MDRACSSYGKDWCKGVDWMRLGQDRDLLKKIRYLWFHKMLGGGHFLTS
jgi:hypothetical protein